MNKMVQVMKLPFVVTSLFMLSCINSETKRYYSNPTYELESPLRSPVFEKEQNGRNTASVRNGRKSRAASTTLGGLNAFMEDVTLSIPPIILDSEKLGVDSTESLDDATLSITDLKVFNVGLQSITHGLQKDDVPDIANERNLFDIEIFGLVLETTCAFLLNRGGDIDLLNTASGTIEFGVLESHVKITIAFKSEDFSRLPPSYALTDQCVADLILTEPDLVFDADWMAKIYNTFWGFGQLRTLVKQALTEVLQTALCGQVDGLINGLLSNTLATTAAAMEPYIFLDDSVTKFLDNSMVNSPNITNETLVDFSNNISTLGSFLSIMIGLIDNFLASEVTDESNPFGNEKDLGINVMLRSSVLDADRVLILDNLPPDLFFENDAAVGHITLTPLKAEVRGLDTFTIFQPLKAFSQTLLSNFELPFLEAKGTLQIDLDGRKFPASPEEFAFTKDSKYSEVIDINFRFEDIFLNVSAEVLFDLESLTDVRLGSFLNISNVLPCALVSLKHFKMINLESTIIPMTPQISSFVDPAIGFLITQLIDSVLVMSENLVKSAFPNYVATTFKDNITTLVNTNINEIKSEECRAFKSNPTAILDFRDLLLEPEEAANAGGSGNLPYGDLCPLLLKIVDENFISEDPDNPGSPMINNVIGDQTEGMSGTRGNLVFNNINTECGLDIDDSEISFQLLNMSIQNIDTFDSQLEFLTPAGNNVLNNRMIIGNSDRPLRFGVEYSTIISFDLLQRPQVKNYFFAMEFKRVELFISIIASFYEESFMRFPLEDVSSVDCWLAAMEIPDGNGPSLGFNALEFVYDDMEVSLACEGCEGSSSVIDLLHDLGGWDLFAKQLIVFVRVLIFGSQENIDTMILDARKKCRYHPDYEGPFNDTDTEELETETDTETDLDAIPVENSCFNSGTGSTSGGGGGGGIAIPPTKDALESMLFLVLFMAEVAYSAVSLVLGFADFELSDPLEKQTALSPEVAKDSLDLSNLNETFLQWLDGPIRQANATVSNMIDDPLSESGKNIGANVYIRNLLDEDDGSLKIPLNFNFPLKANITVTSIKVMGLDTFKNLTLIKFLGPQTIQSNFELEKLSINVIMSVLKDDPSKNETTVIKFGIKDIKFSMGLFLAVNEEKLKAHQLGSVFNSSQLLPCLMRTVTNINITQLYFSFQDMEDLEINGFVSEEISDMIQKTHAKLYEEYRDQQLATVPVLFDRILRNFANDFLDSYRMNDDCVPYEIESRDKFVDFRDLFLKPDDALERGGEGTAPYGNVWSTLYNLMQTTLFQPDENGTPKINDMVVGSITSGQSNISGTLYFPDSPGGLKNGVSFMGVRIMPFYNTTVSNLDTIRYPVVVMDPTEAHSLNNSLLIGTKTRPVTLVTSLLIEPEENPEIANEVELEISSSNMGIKTLLLNISIMEKSFLEFPFEYVVNLDCWIASLPSNELNEFGVADLTKNNGSVMVYDILSSIEGLYINVRCLSCDTPEFQNFANSFAGSGLQRGLQNFLKTEFIQQLVEKRIFEATKSCPSSPEYDPNYNGTFTPFETPDHGFQTAGTFIALFIFVFSCCAWSYCYSFMAKRNAKKNFAVWFLELKDAEILALYMEHNEEIEQKQKLAEMTEAMYVSKEIPLILRMFIPFCVVVNIGLFVSGQLNLGATVDIIISLLGSSYNMEGFYPFSVVTLLDDMWKFASKILTVLLAIPSLIWPYVKQLITLALWFLPPERVSVDKRGDIFSTLDTLAKWSIIDIFVIVIAMTVMRLTLQNGPSLPEGYLRGDLIMYPLWGMYANAFAQIISQLCMHIIRFYHDKIKRNALLKIDAKERKDKESVGGDTRSSSKRLGNHGRRRHQEKEALCNHHFFLGGLERGKKVTVRREANIIVGLMGFLTICCILFGSSAEYLNIEIAGLVGIVISNTNGGAPPVVTQSVISVSKMMIDIGYYLGTPTDIVGMYFVASLVIATCILVPICQCLCVMVMWFVPITQLTRIRLTVMVEVLKAWQYLEVFFIGTLVMLWQAKPISATIGFILCKDFQNIFNTAAEYGFLSDRDARCYLINADLRASVFIHIFASLLLGKTTEFVLKAVDQQSIDVCTKEGAMDTNASIDHTLIKELLTNEKKFQELIDYQQKLPIRFTDYYRFALSKPKSVMGKSYERHDSLGTLDLS